MTAIVERGEPGSSPTAVLNNDSQALAVSGVVKASAAVFLEIVGFNNSGSTRYVHIYDSPTVPAEGTIPACVPIVVPSQGVFSLSFPRGLFLHTGLSWASSTTLQTKTVSGAPDIWATITYK